MKYEKRKKEREREREEERDRHSVKCECDQMCVHLKREFCCLSVHIYGEGLYVPMCVCVCCNPQRLCVFR